MSETESFATASPGDDFVYLAAFQQLVLERTHDLITVLDPAGTIVYASPSWQTLTGWDPDGLVGTPILELVHPDDHEPGARGDGRGARRRRGRGDHRAAAHPRRTLGLGRDDRHSGLRQRRRRRLHARHRARRERARGAARARRARSTRSTASPTRSRARRASTSCSTRRSTRCSRRPAPTAPRCSCYDDEDVMRFRAWRGLSDAYRAADRGPFAVGARRGRSRSPCSSTTSPPPASTRSSSAPCEPRGSPRSRSSRSSTAAGCSASSCSTATRRTRGATARSGSAARSRTTSRRRPCGRARARRCASRASSSRRSCARSTRGSPCSRPTGGLVYANDAAARTIGFEIDGGAARERPRRDARAVRDARRRRRRRSRRTTSRPARAPGRVVGAARPLPHPRDRRGALVGRAREPGPRRRTARSCSSRERDPRRHAEQRRLRARSACASSAAASEMLNETLDCGADARRARRRSPCPCSPATSTVDLYEDGVLRCVGARARRSRRRRELMLRLREQYPPTVDGPSRFSARSAPASRSSSPTCRPRRSRWPTTPSTRERSTSSGTRRGSSCR